MIRGRFLAFQGRNSRLRFLLATTRWLHGMAIAMPQWMCKSSALPAKAESPLPALQTAAQARAPALGLRGANASSLPASALQGRGWGAPTTPARSAIRHATNAGQSGARASQKAQIKASSRRAIKPAKTAPANADARAPAVSPFCWRWAKQQIKRRKTPACATRKQTLTFSSLRALQA